MPSTQLTTARLAFLRHLSKQDSPVLWSKMPCGNRNGAGISYATWAPLCKDGLIAAVHEGGEWVFSITEAGRSSLGSSKDKA